MKVQPKATAVGNGANGSGRPETLVLAVTRP